ncbi:protein ANKUB1 [Rhinophrynus dorsalis]
MRVFIAFDGLCESFNILPGQTVHDVKQMIKDCFHMQLFEDKQGRRFLELVFAGGVLRDEWVLTDVGITLCSTIKCVLKEEDKPALYFFNAVIKEKIPISGDIRLLTEKVSRLKTLISLKSGFPVSVYCLRTPQGKEMYNCNLLSDYELDLGATLRMDVWDGWEEFLRACVIGHKHKIQPYLSRKGAVHRYQERVALYMVAYFGHLELVEWLLKKGVRADEAVGVHPFREWCCETDHPDVDTCAIHAAAEAGQLLVLKAFIAHNVLCLLCPNPLGHTPLRICIQHRHKDCVLYLIMKMWSIVSFPKISLPMSIYVKVKKWLFLAQKQLSAVKKMKWMPEFKTRVGDIVVVDGFTEPKMTTKGLHSLHQDKWKNIMENSKVVFHNGETFNSKGHSYCQSNVKGQKFKLPPIKQASTNPDMNKNKTVQNSAVDIFTNTWKALVPLPHIPSTSNSRPLYLSTPHDTFLLNASLESFSKHSGRTPRENAIYCLGLASEFKEKTWLRQLDMAKTLAKKMIYNL